MFIKILIGFRLFFSIFEPSGVCEKVRQRPISLLRRLQDGMDAVAGVGLWSASRYFVRLAPCWPRFAVCCFLGGVDGQHPPKHGEAMSYHPVNLNRYGHFSIVDHFPWKTIGFPSLCYYAGGHVSFFLWGSPGSSKVRGNGAKI